MTAVTMPASPKTFFRAVCLATVFIESQPTKVQTVMGTPMAMKSPKTSIRKSQLPARSGLSAHWKTPLWKKVWQE